MMQIDELKAATDLVEVVRSFLGNPVNVTGNTYFYMCPNGHDNKTASLCIFDKANDQHFHCFGCGMHGDVVTFIEWQLNLSTKEAIQYLQNGLTGLSPSQLSQIKQNQYQKALEQERIAREKEQRAYALLAEARWHRDYAGVLMGLVDEIDQIIIRAQQEILDRKISVEVTERAMLGLRKDAPWGASISIPWMVKGKLRAIQYRLLDENEGRYRWDERIKNMPSLYNVDRILSGCDKIYVVEGALKCLTLESFGLPAIAYPNKNIDKHWDKRWNHYIKSLMYFVPDPDGTENVERLIRDYKLVNARIIDLPCKPDDFFVMGGTVEDWKEIERYARRIKIE